MVARGIALEPAPGVVVSLAFHIAAFAMLARCQPGLGPRPECGNGIIEGREICDDGNLTRGDGCSEQCTLELELRAVELEEPPPPEPEQPDPPPEPPPESPPEAPPPEPPPPPKAEPKPKPKPKTPPPAEPPPPAAPPPPPAIELPLDQTLGGSNSGVTVIGGSQTRAGEKGGQRDGQKGGVPGGTGKAVGGQKDARAAPVSGAGGSGRTWTPQNDLYIGQAPMPVRVDRIQCPAAAATGLTGVVIMKVRIWRDGEIGRVRVVRGIGNGCDEVAVKALKRAKFKPARGTDGQPYDYEITYEYEFSKS